MGCIGSDPSRKLSLCGKATMERLVSARFANPFLSWVVGSGIPVQCNLDFGRPTLLGYQRHTALAIYKIFYVKKPH